MRNSFLILSGLQNIDLDEFVWFHADCYDDFSKSNLVVKHTFRARIRLIFCMREAMYISHGLRILAGRLALKADLKT